MYASASLTLPRMEGVDTRAGFVFCDKDGHDVFVALTMSNDQGQYSYSVQIISQNGDSWRMHGALKDIGRTASIKNAANSAEGVPFAVLYHNGKLDIWVNNIRVATDCYPTDANDRNLFAPEAKVAVGLQSWNHRTAFSRLTFGESRPLEADWDLSQLSEGIAQCLNDGMMNTAPLDAAYRANRYVQANIELPRAEGIDTRRRLPVQEQKRRGRVRGPDYEQRKGPIRIQRTVYQQRRHLVEHQGERRWHRQGRGD